MLELIHLAGSQLENKNDGDRKWYYWGIKHLNATLFVILTNLVGINISVNVYAHIRNIC